MGFDRAFLDAAAARGPGDLSANRQVPWPIVQYREAIQLTSFQSERTLRRRALGIQSPTRQRWSSAQHSQTGGLHAAMEVARCLEPLLEQSGLIEVGRRYIISIIAALIRQQS